jgi:hypothetical protein
MILATLTFVASLRAAHANPNHSYQGAPSSADDADCSGPILQLTSETMPRADTLAETGDKLHGRG